MITDVTAPSTRITIPAPPLEKAASADWRDAPLQRRHMADRTRTAESDGTYFGENGGSVADIIDVINPLQHIPFVSTLYRELTGDTISTAAKFAGSLLLGGPVGLIASIADTIFENETGAGITKTAFNLISGESPDAPTQVASAAPQSTSSSRALRVSDAEILEIQPAAADAMILGSGASSIADARQKLAASRYQSQTEKLQFAQADILPAESVSSPLRVPNTAGLMSGAAQDSTVMDLFGGSAAPAAHQSYNKANMLGYLRESSTQRLNG